MIVQLRGCLYSQNSYSRYNYNLSLYKDSLVYEEMKEVTLIVWSCAHSLEKGQLLNCKLVCACSADMSITVYTSVKLGQCKDLFWSVALHTVASCLKGV